MNPRRLSARLFYLLVAGGFTIGIASATAAGWLYLRSSTPRPVGRTIWDGSAEAFVLPICMMIGGTFGGLFGVALAASVSAVAAKDSTPQDVKSG